MKLFVRGLALFAIGLAFIAAGNYFHHLWQIPGLLFLALGILTAAWGYIGIFSHRLQRIFSRLNSPSDLS